MTTSSTVQASQSAQQAHLQVTNQLRNPVSSPSIPGNVFEDYDFEPSQTPTRPLGGDQKLPDGSPASPLLGNSVDNLKLERLLADTIFEKGVRRNRAKVPPEIEQEDRLSIEAKTGNGRKSPAGTTGGKKHSQSVLNIHYPPVDDRTRLQRISLEWGHAQGKGNDEQKCVLDTRGNPPGVNVEVQSQVIWQQSELENIRLDELSNMVNSLEAAGLEKVLIGLSKRLLNKVRVVAERSLLNGSFLTPWAMRYDLRDSLWYKGSMCCIFVNFPYFAMGEERKQSMFEKGDDRHPIRTLLQSRYRLNETVDRDKLQCVRTISGSALKSCIRAPGKETEHLGRKANDELIYVPQMWTLIMGPDHILTVGPSNDNVLQTSIPTPNENLNRNDARICAFVRISFVDGNIVEGITYPREQCASWFGLLSKHQEIRNVLSQQKRERASQNFPLTVGEQILSDRIWASVQRLGGNPILNVRMKVPEPLKVTVKDSSSGDSSPRSPQLADDDDDLSQNNGFAQPPASAVFEELRQAPVVKAFLAWPVMDEDDEVDISTANVRIKRFLEDIHAWLLTKKANGDVDHGPQPAQSGSNRNFERDSRIKLGVQGKTLENVRTLCSMDSSAAAPNPGRTQTLTECEKLIGYFVPNDYDQNAACMQFFWGALYGLLAHDCSFLQNFVAMVQMINDCANSIHLGVHCEQQQRIGAEGPRGYKDAISKDAILEDSMVRALRAIFCMFLEAFRDKSRSSESHSQDLPRKVDFYGKEACQLLKSARGQLIAEPTRATPEGNMGPVVTPEAILLKTISRLTRGVFHTGTVDVINIYEECLEQLALRVEKYSSRRLLQKLNAFEEEIDIVDGVLSQQINVLLKLRGCLDPATFERPNIVRKMRFEFERKHTEKILDHIKEQQRHCKELRERAHVLAVQNVQLVETLADDNSRAIFVFTFITVLFLPLSFVAGFFGMNLLADSTKGVGQFWYIAVPLTVGILILCAVFIAWGELLWFAASDLPGKCRDMLLGRGSRVKA
ncbi:MAG: hypothetical protein Q9215_002968 [Flavoplaca cf. flavocitrina]